MNMLAQFDSSAKTMNNKELLEIINLVRAEFGEPELRLNKFNEKIEDELEGDNYTKSVVQNLNNTTSVIYELTIDQCMLVSMRESKAVRKNVLAKLKAKQLPQSFSEALQLAADQAKQLELQAPKVEYYNKVVERSALLNASQVAQKLKMSAVKMNKLLDAFNVYHHGVKRARLFQQWFIDKGLGEVKQTELGFSQPMFTTKGEAWVIEKLVSEGVA